MYIYKKYFYYFVLLFHFSFCFIYSWCILSFSFLFYCYTHLFLIQKKTGKRIKWMLHHHKKQIVRRNSTNEIINGRSTAAILYFYKTYVHTKHRSQLGHQLFSGFASIKWMEWCQRKILFRIFGMRLVQL